MLARLLFCCARCSRQCHLLFMCTRILCIAGRHLCLQPVSTRQFFCLCSICHMQAVPKRKLGGRHGKHKLHQLQGRNLLRHRRSIQCHRGLHTLCNRYILHCAWRSKCNILHPVSTWNILQCNIGRSRQFKRLQKMHYGKVFFRVRQQHLPLVPGRHLL